MTERDEQVAQDYMDGMSVPALANVYGLSKPRIWQILDQRGVSGSTERKQVRRVPMHIKPITRSHEVLGRRLSEFKLDRLIDGRDLSQRLNWSVQKLTAMERGRKDPTLTELMEISRLLKIPIGVILSEHGV